jgi:hypothetical protein
MIRAVVSDPDDAPTSLRVTATYAIFGQTVARDVTMTFDGKYFVAQFGPYAETVGPEYTNQVDVTINATDGTNPATLTSSAVLIFYDCPQG